MQFMVFTKSLIFQFNVKYCVTQYGWWIRLLLLYAWPVEDEFTKPSSEATLVTIRVQIWSVQQTRCVILMCIGEHTLFSVYSANHINPFADWIQTNGFTLQTNSTFLATCTCMCLCYVCMQSYMHVCRHVCTGMCRHRGSHRRWPVLSWKPGSGAHMAGTLSTKPSAQPFATLLFHLKRFCTGSAHSVSLKRWV